MPRRVRQDLSYFTLDCDIFSLNSKLKPLIDRYGGDGLGLYIHILCDVYSKGYYFKPNDYEDYLYSLAKEFQISVEKVQLIIAFMTERTLLDAFTLNKNTVITSHGIQERYAEAMKGRKRSVAEIKGEYWLLTEKEEREIDTFYKTQPFANKSEKIPDKSEKIPDKSEIYPTTEQNQTERVCMCNKHTFVKPTVEEITAYGVEIGKTVNAQRFYDFYESKGWTVGSQPMKDWRACVRKWEEKAEPQLAVNKEKQTADKQADEASSIKANLLDADPAFYENERALRLANIAIAKGDEADLTEILKERERILAAHGLTNTDIGDKTENE